VVKRMLKSYLLALPFRSFHMLRALRECSSDILSGFPASVGRDKVVAQHGSMSMYTKPSAYQSVQFNLKSSLILKTLNQKI
jgi:hypothetical protein